MSSAARALDYDVSEAEERRQAEIEFVAAAFPDADEAWTELWSSSTARVRRRLRLRRADDSDSSSRRPDDDNGGGIDIILTMNLPEGYPVREDAILDVEASICTDDARPSSSSSSAGGGTKGLLRKMVMDALPDLVGACRSVAEEMAGSEAVFSVLGRADEWVAVDWVDIVESGADGSTNGELDDDHGGVGGGGSNIRDDSGDDDDLVLGRRLIHSHHIIAPGKRKAIVELAQNYDLGGYAKIGWPGIIVIEGEECDCISYVEEIRSMRWQHLVVRGEQQIPVADRTALAEARVIPVKMRVVGNKMSGIAELCREAGLQELFMTSMKIYKGNEADEAEVPSMPDKEIGGYGALVHVDHMRDGRNYRKWLRKAAATADCTLMLKMCEKNAKHPLILVGIVGDEDDVRRVLKRWRTSRVDVDSSGRPCLERMMTVLVEGQVEPQSCDDVSEGVSDHLDNTQEEEKMTVSEECLEILLRVIGGVTWSDACQALLA